MGPFVYITRKESFSAAHRLNKLNFYYLFGLNFFNENNTHILVKA